MTFAEQEISRDLGEPIKLILFRFGPGVNDIVGYTDSEYAIEFDEPANGDIAAVTVNYTPEPIAISEIVSSGSLDKANVEIQLSENASIVELFRYRPPSSVVTVTIREGHANDLDMQYLAGWVGRVTSFGIKDEIGARLGCEPVATSMKRSGLRRHYQYGCPHPLYGSQCRANKVAATRASVVTARDGAWITLSSNWDTAVRIPKYIGGMAEWTLADGRTEKRTIIETTTDFRMLLSYIPNGLDVGETVNLILGCNHKMEDCRDLHNNILNFGGQPFIPLENPVGIKNNYY